MSFVFFSLVACHGTTGAATEIITKYVSFCIWKLRALICINIVVINTKYINGSLALLFVARGWSSSSFVVWMTTYALHTQYTATRGWPTHSVITLSTHHTSHIASCPIVVGNSAIRNKRKIWIKKIFIRKKEQKCSKFRSNLIQLLLLWFRSHGLV